jgi:hypothetical protein
MDGTPGTYHTINGTKLLYQPDASGQSIQHEIIAFHVHQPDLLTLSKTSAMEFRVQGANGTVRRCVAADQFKHLNDFIGVASHYEGSAVASAAP